MLEDHDYGELFEEFPELSEDDVIYTKEVLAHFGLLFASYADLETGIQQCYTNWQLRTELGNGKIETEQKWVERYDALEAKAVAATFGSLLRMVDSLDRLEPHMDKLRVLKKRRDYFAHHFFRKENDKMHSNESILFLMWRMHVLRQEVDALATTVSTIYAEMTQALYPNKDMVAQITAECSRLAEEYFNDPPTKVGWEID